MFQGHIFKNKKQNNKTKTNFLITFLILYFAVLSTTQVKEGTEETFSILRTLSFSQNIESFTCIFDTC